MRAAFLAIAAVVLSGVLAQPAQANVSFDFAYSNLSPHGSWLVSTQYGHVWQPREYDREWNPYYDGHWVDTNMGWTWVSDYQWGSIPYHYGTWVADPRYGWVWIPGQVWAPSWVVFRTSPDYIGWAPVPPGFSVGVSMEFGGPSSFIYVSSRDFLAPRLRTAIIPAARTTVFINNTTVINNIVIQNDIVVNLGPDVRIIEKATGRTIQRQQIEHVARVAPFAQVTRAELAVTPERAKRGVRVAEPVPASQPLPVAGQQGRPDKQGKERARGGQQAQPPSSSASAPPPPAAKDKSNAKQKGNPPAPVDAQKAPPVAKHKSDPKPKSNEQAPADTPKAKNATPSPSPSQSAATTDAANKAKAKTDAKAKKDEKAKKDSQDKKHSGSDKGTTPPAQDGPDQ